MTKKNKKANTNKLSLTLHTETIRSLSANDLTKAVGGTSGLMACNQSGNAACDQHPVPV